MSEKLLPVKADDKELHCLADGSIIEAVEQPGADNSGECFTDDEFICPACCCGVYIEVKE